jgi:hypothetical protein
VRHTLLKATTLPPASDTLAAAAITPTPSWATITGKALLRSTRLSGVPKPIVRLWPFKPVLMSTAHKVTRRGSSGQERFQAATQIRGQRWKLSVYKRGCSHRFTMLDSIADSGSVLLSACSTDLLQGKKLLGSDGCQPPECTICTSSCNVERNFVAVCQQPHNTIAAHMPYASRQCSHLSNQSNQAASLMSGPAQGLLLELRSHITNGSRGRHGAL